MSDEVITPVESVVEEDAHTQTHTDTHTELSPLDRLRLLRDMSIYERIDAAYAEISQTSFTKDGTVRVSGSAGYKFISIGQILEPVRKAHGRWGVKVFFGTPEYCTEKGEKRFAIQRGGGTWQVANGHIKVRIIGRDEEDCIDMTVPFEAQDNSDKLTNKILTNAERCLYRTLYAIDEGDASDPEAVNVPIPGENTARVREQAKDDPFFGSKKEKKEEKVKPVIDDHLPNAKELSEATYGPSTVSDRTFTRARVAARKWMAEHQDDEFVQSQIQRFGTSDLSAWPRAHVVDIANLWLEAQGEELLTYDLPKGARE